MKNLCYKSRTSLRIGKNLIFSKTNNNPSDIIQKCITKIISTSYIMYRFSCKCSIWFVYFNVYSYRWVLFAYNRYIWFKRPVIFYRKYIATRWLN